MNLSSQDPPAFAFRSDGVNADNGDLEFGQNGIVEMVDVDHANNGDGIRRKKRKTIQNKNRANGTTSSSSGSGVVRRLLRRQNCYFCTGIVVFLLAGGVTWYFTGTSTPWASILPDRYDQQEGKVDNNSEFGEDEDISGSPGSGGGGIPFSDHYFQAHGNHKGAASWNRQHPPPRNHTEQMWLAQEERWNRTHPGIPFPYKNGLNRYDHSGSASDMLKDLKALTIAERLNRTKMDHYHHQPLSETKQAHSTTIMDETTPVPKISSTPAPTVASAEPSDVAVSTTNPTGAPVTSTGGPGAENSTNTDTSSEDSEESNIEVNTTSLPADETKSKQTSPCSAWTSWWNATVYKEQGVKYNVLNEIDHDPAAFTQGLTFANGILYESTGLNGQSSVRILDRHNGTVMEKYDMDMLYFGEGMTWYKDKLVQITWKSKKGFIYDPKNLAAGGTPFSYVTHNGEGWGITYDEASDEFIVTDGSPFLTFWDPSCITEAGGFHCTPKREIEVNRLQDSSSVSQNVPPAQAHNLNEIEFWRDRVIANVWYEDVLLVIDPTTGKVEKEYDMSALFEKRNQGANVFNGISITEDPNVLLVTGKQWSKMFEIELFPYDSCDDDVPLVSGDGTETSDNDSENTSSNDQDTPTDVLALTDALANVLNEADESVEMADNGDETENQNKSNDESDVNLLASPPPSPAASTKQLSPEELEAIEQKWRVTPVFKSDGIMYEVLRQFPHDSQAFTQGLTVGVRNGKTYLYESTGLKGRSSIRIVDMETGEVKKKVKMDDNFFGEGMTFVKDKLVQIVWHKQIGFVYNPDTLEVERNFTYETTKGEGWGITYNEMDDELIVTDGSRYLLFWDGDCYEKGHCKPHRSVPTYRIDGKPATKLNEIEFFRGKVLANVWYEDVVLAINHVNGAVEKEYDFKDLWPKEERSKAKADVLNGISVTADPETLLVTGKLWDRMYEVKLLVN